MYETWCLTCAGQEMTGIFEEHDDNLDESDCGSVRKKTKNGGGCEGY